MYCARFYINNPDLRLYSIYFGAQYSAGRLRRELSTVDPVAHRPLTAQLDDNEVREDSLNSTDPRIRGKVCRPPFV